MHERIYKYLFPFLLLSIPVLASAAINQVTFTTDTQRVAPQTVSGTITVQLQDAAGTVAPATETMDVEFTSTSASGEFLSPSTENPVTKTISTGSANKNFRYRDTAQGTFVLTVKVKGRTSGSSFSTTQSIVVSSDPVATSTDSSTSTSTSTSQNNNGSSTSSNPPPSSVYYNGSGISLKVPQLILELSAGSDRLATAGSPLEFRVQSNIAHAKNGDFVWNFGDGSEGRGEVVTHTYDYPGEYAVTLNASFPEGSAVSQITVKVVAPDLWIISADGEKIEVRNNSPVEVSLFGRALYSGGKTFVFPQDTIMRAGASVAFASKFTGLSPTGPYDAQFLLLGEAEQGKISQRIEEEKLHRVTEIRQEIGMLQGRLSAMQSSAPLPIAKITPTLPQEASSTIEGVSTPESAAESAIAAKSGWLGTFKKFFLEAHK